MHILPYMDAALNPYAPGAGIRPPAMVGRDAQLTEMTTAIERTRHHLPSRPLCLWGLRGVGKTVLLNALRRQAESAGWLTASLEAAPTPGERALVRQRFARDLISAARKMNVVHRHALRRALGSIGSFSISVGVAQVSLGATPTAGRADTGDTVQDLTELADDICADLIERGLGFAIFVDEMQDLDDEFTAALVTTQHKANQEGWPLFVVGAGLPGLPSRLSGVRTYAERLFAYSEIGPLPPDEAAVALTQPAAAQGAAFTTAATDRLVTASSGYPYFLQEFGKAIWDVAEDSPFTAADADRAVHLGIAALDSGFFPARWERATAAERAYLAAMATDGEAGSVTGRIADRLGKTVQALGPTRAQLIAKGLVYAPERGQLRFTVPGMADFIDRQTG